MIAVSLAEVAELTAGRLSGADPTLLVTAPAAVDSRSVAPGGLFVAIRGERVDGHHFAAAAVDAGAVACLVARPVSVPSVVVADPVLALGRLAAAVRARLRDCTVIGITGSSGKTGTKDLLRHVLAARGETVAPPGSYNTEVGVPLTLLRADAATRHLVIEMGARSTGHIAYLADIAAPRIGVVLNVGMAHVGEFGSQDAIARAKGELVESLPPEGTAVLNADDPSVAAMRDRTRASVLTFGIGPDADMRVRQLRLDPSGRPTFVLSHGGVDAEVRLPLLGAHAALNAAAAAAAAICVGMPLAQVAAALTTAEALSPWRMEPQVRHDGLLVVNDAYNANPDSVRAALETVVTLAAARPGSRSYAVLGEMRELGRHATAAHEEVGRLAVRLGIDRLVAVGEAAQPVLAAARSAGASEESSVSVRDATAATAWVRARARPPDVVLVKASRTVGLERVAEGLLAEEEPAS